MESKNLISKSANLNMFLIVTIMNISLYVEYAMIIWPQNQKQVISF